MDELYRAALGRLSKRPGTCAQAGCGGPLTAVAVEPWADEAPPLRFGCPAHDVWLGHCFDYAGLYIGCLRDPSDPVWRWLPEHMRSAAARAGFGVREVYVHPRVRFGPWRGRAWATDNKNIICVGEASELHGMEHRLDLVVTPASARERVVAEHRLTGEELEAFFNRLNQAQYTERSKGRPSDAGYDAQWDDHIAVGAAVVPAWPITMIDDLFGGCRWRAAGRVDPVVALRRDAVVAVMMPIDTVEVERRRRGKVCPAQHRWTSGDGSVMRDYGCQLRPGHDGPDHGVQVLGGAWFWWDEREYARTDQVAGSDVAERTVCP